MINLFLFDFVYVVNGSSSKTIKRRRNPHTHSGNIRFVSVHLTLSATQIIDIFFAVIRIYCPDKEVLRVAETIVCLCAVYSR